MRKRIFLSIRSFLFLSLCLAFYACSPSKPTTPSVIFQSSVIDALSQGVFEGDLTCTELLQQGDFGLGTFNDLDGEMIVLDGQVYQVKSDGSVLKPGPSTQLPFATVTFFRPDQKISLDKELSYAQIKDLLDAALPFKNIFYAIRIDGKFSQVTVRSVPPQWKPYPDLAQAISEQRIFQKNDLAGTIIGFWFPHYAKNINAAGYHFHFIDRTRTFAGHLLDARLISATASIQSVYKLNIALPKTANFDSTDLTQEQHVIIPEK